VLESVQTTLCFHHTSQLHPLQVAHSTSDSTNFGCIRSFSRGGTFDLTNEIAAVLESRRKLAAGVARDSDTATTATTTTTVASPNVTKPTQTFAATLASLVHRPAALTAISGLLRQFGFFSDNGRASVSYTLSDC
jgi:hypothetical protein